MKPGPEKEADFEHILESQSSSASLRSSEMRIALHSLILNKLQLLGGFDPNE